MVVIYDRSGEFVKSYYDPSIDKILNPLDARCAAWDLWKECLTQPDFDNTANTLIPMGTKEDPFWQGSGRTIFAEAAYLMRNDPNRSYSNWWTHCFPSKSKNCVPSCVIHRRQPGGREN